MNIERAWPAGVPAREIPPYAQKLYAQVVKAQGTQIHVAGCMAFDENNDFVGAGDMAAQTRQVLEVILKSLAHFQAGAANVVRTKTYVTDIDEYLKIGHQEWLAVFAQHLPVSTLVEVSRLTEPRAVVEIEAYAVI